MTYLLDAMEPRVGEFVALRRDIHRHPELAFEEHRTAALVADKLEGWGYAVERGVGGTGVVGRLVRGRGGRRLGLRAAGEETADAIVRGTITRYEPDVPVAYRGNDAESRVSVTRRLVQITVSVEIIDQQRNRTLWQRSGLLVEGDYEPDSETERQAREEALEKLASEA